MYKDTSTGEYVNMTWDGSKFNGGGVSFMGISAKLVSANNGVYQVKSSLGNFSVNTRKGTITKK